MLYPITFLRGFMRCPPRSGSLNVAGHSLLASGRCSEASQWACTCTIRSAYRFGATASSSAAVDSKSSPVAYATASSPPPPLSILSWSVDGSAHTHHRCGRRLSMAERIPLVCETIRAASPDVVALQDSTPELAEALTRVGELGEVPPEVATKDSLRAPITGGLHIYGVELARGQSQVSVDVATPPSTNLEALPVDTPSEPSELSSSAPAPSIVNAQEEGGPGNQAPPTPALNTPCGYRLVGRARNGRCGEVQMFIKDSCAWEAQLLPGMGAGLSAVLNSREFPPTSSPLSSTPDVDPSNTKTGDAAGPAVADEGNNSSSSLSESRVPRRHRCVLTTLDLSYRGKSLGTNEMGLIAGSSVSADGSPFTLQTQQPTGAAALGRRHGRLPGELDAHRAMALSWVSHHVRPDIVVGNLFLGAREHVPGFEDAWARAGSPAGQERTTNTCARHRIDRITNYYYFRPSPGVASSAAAKKVRRWRELNALQQDRTPLDGEAGQASSLGPSLSTDEQGRSNTAAASLTGTQAAVSGAVEGEATLDPIVVAADAPVGTPIPLAAYRDAQEGVWRLGAATDHPPSSAVNSAGVPPEQDSIASELSKEPALTKVEGDAACVSGDTSVGMPEVAGRFQRSLLRGWVRRGPASRSGQFSARPFQRQYRHCRVVALRPMIEVELTEAEREWHSVYIAAQYSRHFPQARHKGTTEDGSDTKSLGSNNDDDAAPTSLLHRVKVPTRVRCSVSDQYPLVTLFK